MQQRILISYANEVYAGSQKKLMKSLIKECGITQKITYNDKWLKKQRFYEANKAILSLRRGAGYMIWKPYIILETIKKVANDQDIVIYCDSDMIVTGSLEPLFKLCEENNGLLIFDNSVHKNSAWVKRDCFILMDADNHRFYEADHCMSGFLVLQKKDWVINLLEDWLKYATDYRISTDADNELGLPNLPDFVEHRHDQSILSILRIKYNLSLFRDPTQFGNPYKLPEFRLAGEFLNKGIYEKDSLLKNNSPYPTLIEISGVEEVKINLLRRILKKIKHPEKK